MVFLDQMVPSSERHQVSIVCRCRYGDRASAPDIRVTQLVGQTLQLVRCEVVVIPQHVVVRRPASPLYAGVRTQVEVELGRMCDASIDRGASRNVARLADLLFLVGAEESGVVALLYHDEGDARFVLALQTQTRLAHRH